ncbi:MAG: heme-binding protein [Thiopseudomonas sp.]|nr:heme-binding protein [Thiopseudomonas sp.]
MCNGHRRIKIHSLLKEENFEVRDYEPHILAETVAEGEFDGAGSKAFSRLFKYITGNNTARQNIDMTASIAKAIADRKADNTSEIIA